MCSQSADFIAAEIVSLISINLTQMRPPDLMRFAGVAKPSQNMIDPKNQGVGTEPLSRHWWGRMVR